MGVAQSAPREGEEDAADGEESGKLDDAQTEHTIEDKPLKNKGQISEINGEADSSKAEVNGHCEDEITAKAVLSPNEDVSQTETPFKEEKLLENSEINEKESPNEAGANEDIPLKITEMNAKQNDINGSFWRFFNNIGMKLTVKRGSGEIPKDLPNDTNKEEPNRPDQDMAQERCGNDSTTCPTLTDVTSEEVLENAEEKEVETKVKVESDNGNAAMTSPPGEVVNQETTTEEKPLSTSLSSPEEVVVVVSPVKRFFTTGLFSGVRKKKKPADDETTDKEINDTGKEEVVQKTDGTVQDQQEDKEDIGPGVDAAAVETEHEREGHELKGEMLSTAQPIDASTDSSSIFVTVPELLSSQEKDKVQGSPMKRLLLGCNLKKLSKKQRSRRSSDATSCNSGEHESDQLLSSTEKAEDLKEEGCVQPSRETAGEEEGAWASFKKLVTPKKRIRKCSLSSEGTQIPDLAEEQKPSDGGQMSDHSTEEGKKRKDSSVSWESVLCRSGRRRSRKTSDSEDETPQIKKYSNKPDSGSKLDVNNEVDEMFAHSSKQASAPSDGNGASTWQSLKRLVTPKKKAKGEDESKDNVQSDSEVTQDESSLPRKRKKRKSTEKQDQVSSGETDKEAASGEEDSDTPAVVPLSEFDTDETEVCIQPHDDAESLLLKEAVSEIQQDLLDPKAEPLLPCDNLKTEAKKVQGNNAASENQATTTRATDEEPDDLTESIRKQQLSDIPEEATAALVTEEAAREDTIADDLVEITSEAITAAEHLDITLADETEMISAVSQLSSESSKTSGNTTPVPAQYVVEETDVLLYQVVETISVSPVAVPVCSYELRSERTAFSVSHQILETFVKEVPTILKLHRSTDATKIDTFPKLVELDAKTECVDTTQIESIFEVNDSVSTEILSELLTEKFNTAEITEDEVEEVDIAHPVYSVTELGDVEENINKLAEVDKIVADEGSLVEENQTKTEPPELDSQEADFAATVADDIKDGPIEQEVQSEDDNQQPVEVEYLPELANVQTLKSLEEDIISEAIPAGETLKNKLKEELQTYAVQPEHDHVPEAPECEKASTLDPDGGSLQSQTEEVKSEDILPAETVTDEPNLEVEHHTEVNVDPENQELQVNLMKTVICQVLSDNAPGGETDEPQKETMLLPESNLEPEDASTTGNVPEQEVLKAVHATEIASTKGSVQSFKKEAISVPEGETGTDEPKHSAQVLSEVSVEPENKELHVIGMKIVPELEVFQAGRAPKPFSEEDSVRSLEEEFIPLNVLEGEADEPKEETTCLHEANHDPVDASKTEHVQESVVFEAVQQTRLDSEEVSVLSERDETNNKDVPQEETVTAEPKPSAEVLPEGSVEPENEELPANVIKMVQVTETSEVIQAPILASEGGVQSLDKEVISELVSDKKADEPKEGTIYLSEDIVVPVDAYQTQHVKEPQAPKAIPAPTLDSEEGSMQSPNEEVQSVDILTAETVADETKQSAQVHPKVSVEPENKELHVIGMKIVPELEVFPAGRAPKPFSEEDSVRSLEEEFIPLNVTEGEADEPKEETTRLHEANHDPVDASKTEHVQESEVFEAVKQTRLDSEEVSVSSEREKTNYEDVPPEETVTAEPKQSAEVVSEIVPDKKADEPKEGTIYLSVDIIVPVDAYPTQHVKEPQAPKAVPEPTLDSEEGSMQSNEEVQSVDISTAETVADETKQSAQVHPKVSVEPENKELVTVMETIHATEVLDAVQAPTLDLEEGISQSLKIEVILLNLPEEETVSNEPIETEKHLTEVCVEPLDAFKTEQAQEPEVIQSIQAATADSEECSVQSLEKRLITEEITEGETVTDEPKQEAFPFTEDNLELLDASTTGQETQVLQAEPAAPLDSEGAVLLSPEKEVICEDIPVTEEPEQEIEIEPEKIPVEASETERIQEPEALASDVIDCATETKVVAGTSTCMQVVTESMEGRATLEFEKTISIDDVPIHDIGSVVASVTEEGVAPPGPSLEKAEAQRTESTARDTGMEQDDYIPIVLDKLLTLTAACVSAGKEEAGNVQVLEKTTLTVDAAVTNESKHKEHPSTVQAAVEGPKDGECSGTEVKSTSVEHAVEAQVGVCDIKDVLVAIPDVLIEKTSPITEPLREIVTQGLMSKEHVETSAPLVVPDQKAEAAEGSSVVVTMHVPSVELEDNHRIQVQVVGHDIKSAESSVDTVLEVGITQVKEVIDACHTDVEKVNDLYANPQIEEEFINEHDKVTIEGFILHAKENLPEKEAESMVDNLGQEGVEQPDAVGEESETVESESAHSLERQEQTSTVMSLQLDSEGPEDLMLTADIPAYVDVPIQPQGDGSEETKVEEHKQAQTIQTLIVAPANTEVISFIGNIDSSSSLSIQLKLNINSGQANEPASPPPTTERSGPANEADVSEVQAVEAEPVKATKHVESAGVAVQGTANTEPAENMDPKERSVIATQPVLLHISIQAMEAEEQIKSPEMVTSSVQDTETKQPVRQTETTEGFPAHTVLSEACEQQTEAKTPPKQKEEDQDVWMDAEEDVYTQEKTEACRLEVEEPPREAEAGLEHVVKMTEEEESQQKMLKTAERCGTDSECEDFVFAPEHPEIGTVRVTTTE